MTTAVIGGGLVGLATARALLRRGHEVVVIEKEDGWARHQSGHNSGVVHSGLYYRPGTLKAQLAREAAESMGQVCAELGVSYRRTGKMIVALEESELDRMRALAARGAENGVPVREIGLAEAAEREPYVSCVGALWVESTGVCDFVGLAERLAEDLTEHGADLRLSTRVLGLRPVGGRVEIETDRGLLRVERAVNCSGLFSDRLLPAEERAKTRIVPFRGEYFSIVPERAHLVKGLVYPVPNPELPFLGVHLTRGFDDHVHVGPNAVFAFRREGYRWRDVSVSDTVEALTYPGLWRMVGRHWRSGIGDTVRSLLPPLFVREVRRMLPEIGPQDLVRSPAGVRAQAVNRDGSPSDDFVMVPVGKVLHVVNAPSPAATASLLIGERIAGALLG